MDNTNDAQPSQLVFVMQIISVSLILGVLVFLGVAFVMTQGQQPKPPMLTYVALGFTGLTIIGHWLFRMPVRPSQAAVENFDLHSEQLFRDLAPYYQTEHIIKMALLEGAAFFNGVVYMQEANWWNLAAMGLLVFLMLIRFPTQSRVIAWIERRTVAWQFGDTHN